MDLDITEGVLIDSVGVASAAEDSGLERGDVIIKVNNSDVKTAAELQELIARKRPGDEVEVVVLRNGKEKAYDVVLKNRSGDTKVVEREAVTLLASLGAEFRTIDKKKAEKLDISGGVQVVRLLPGKLRKQTGMREGFIITKVDGEEVTNESELINVLENKSGGILLEGVYEDIPGSYYYGFGL
jgi:S1-C subfamily serine protease